MNTVLKAQAFGLHTEIIQLYTASQRQWTHYILQNLQKFKNPKYQKVQLKKQV